MPTAPSAQISATLAMIVEAITSLGKGFIVFEIKTSKARPTPINRPAMAAKSEAVHATDGGKPHSDPGDDEKTGSAQPDADPPMPASRSCVIEKSDHLALR